MDGPLKLQVLYFPFPIHVFVIRNVLASEIIKMMQEHKNVCYTVPVKCLDSQACLDQASSQIVEKRALIVQTLAGYGKYQELPRGFF